MLLLSHPCMSYDDFVAWKERLDDISKENGNINQHGFVQANEVQWPGIVITSVEEVPNSRNKRYITHTVITKVRLLKILGLSTEDIKIQFECAGMAEVMPENFEAREI